MATHPEQVMGRRAYATRMAEQQSHRRICAEIVTDLEADAMKLDGVPFTGRGMGETFGTLMATVQALARITAAMLDREVVQP